MISRRTMVSATLAFAAGAVFGVPAAVSGCKSEILPVKEPKKCQLQVVTLTVLASPTINPTNEGDPRPVIVRIYQLKNDVNLQNAKFEQIWKDDAKTLGEDLVKVDEVAIYPNSRSEIKFERDDSATFVAAVALFRNPKGKSWFTTFELPPAPSKGECGQPCNGDECEKKEIPQPVFVVWIDGTKIDAGEDHVDDFPDAGRVQVVNLSAGAAPAGSGAPAAKGGKPAPAAKPAAPKAGGK